MNFIFAYNGRAGKRLSHCLQIDLGNNKGSLSRNASEIKRLAALYNPSYSQSCALFVLNIYFPTPIDTFL